MYEFTQELEMSTIDDLKEKSPTLKQISSNVEDDFELAYKTFDLFEEDFEKICVELRIPLLNEIEIQKSTDDKIKELIESYSLEGFEFKEMVFDDYESADIIKDSIQKNDSFVGLREYVHGKYDLKSTKKEENDYNFGINKIKYVLPENVKILKEKIEEIRKKGESYDVESKENEQIEKARKHVSEICETYFLRFSSFLEDVNKADLKYQRYLKYTDKKSALDILKNVEGFSGDTIKALKERHGEPIAKESDE